MGSEASIMAWNRHHSLELRYEAKSGHFHLPDLKPQFLVIASLEPEQEYWEKRKFLEKKL